MHLRERAPYRQQILERRALLGSDPNQFGIHLGEEAGNRFGASVERNDPVAVAAPEMIRQLYEAHLCAANRKGRKYVKQRPGRSHGCGC